MSQTNLIYCKPIPELEKYWQFLGSEGQLFYDYRLNLFTFRKGTEFMTISIKDNLPVPDIKYQIKVTYFFCFCSFLYLLFIVKVLLH